MSNYYWATFVALFLLRNSPTNANDCSPRTYDEDSFVCVCNATFCDSLPKVPPLTSDEFVLFTTNRDGLRFEQTSGEFGSGNASHVYAVQLDSSGTFQTIKGFGGSFTDATGINVKALPDEAQRNFVEALFGEDGSEYTLCRVPIGGTDFSTRGYSYADSSEGSLDGFELQEEDFLYKLPLIREAFNISDGNLELFSSLWSAPPWMKYNDDFPGDYLKEEYYQMLADYYLKFFRAYAEEGVHFWATTTQNEPSTGVLGLDINSIAWLPDQLISWLTDNLGPTLKNSEFSDLKIIIHDDNRIFLPVVQLYFEEEKALRYIDGVGVHWYEDFFTPIGFLDYAKTDKKDVFLLSTEACPGYLPLEKDVALGSWDRAAAYATNIIDVLNKDGIGWLEWCMALDLEGGPTYISNFVDASIIVNSTSGEFYKQPMYYALAHFSKYLPKGSIRIDSSESDLATLAGIRSTAFLRPDGLYAVVIENTGSNGHSVDVVRDDGQMATLFVTGKSVNTLVFAV